VAHEVVLKVDAAFDDARRRLNPSLLPALSEADKIAALMQTMEG
jgi:hypothetical protein